MNLDTFDLQTMDYQKSSTMSSPIVFVEALSIWLHKC